MGLFTEIDYGKTISQDLSNYLRQYTTTRDRADVNAATGIGTSTIRDLVFRRNTLTLENSKSITELSKLAVKNSREKISTSTRVQREIIQKLGLK